MELICHPLHAYGVWYEKSGAPLTTSSGAQQRVAPAELAAWEDAGRDPVARRAQSLTRDAKSDAELDALLDSLTA